MDLLLACAWWHVMCMLTFEQVGVCPRALAVQGDTQGKGPEANGHSVVSTCPADLHGCPVGIARKENATSHQEGDGWSLVRCQGNK